MPHPVVYLDNASTSWPKPPAVAIAMGEFLHGGAATPGRGAYAMATDAGRTIDRLRRRLATLVGADDPERIILAPSATDAINTAILGLFAARPARIAHVVTTDLEHNAITRTLAHLLGRGVISVTSVAPDPLGLLSPGSVADACTSETVLVAVTHVSNVLGTIQPIAEIAAAVHRAAPRALLMVDACQSVGLVPIQVARESIDLLAFSGHKALLGPGGVGALYLGPRAFPGADGLAVEPTRFGGTGIDSTSSHMPGVLPTRFEPGTPNAVGQVGLLAALEDATRPTQAETLTRERALVDQLLEAVSDVTAIRVVGPRDRAGCVGLLSLTVDGCPPDEVAAALDASFGIAVRAGLQCAPGTHRAMGTFDSGGTVRVSPGPYSTPEHMDTLAVALRELVSAE